METNPLIMFALRYGSTITQSPNSHVTEELTIVCAYLESGTCLYWPEEKKCLQISSMLIFNLLLMLVWKSYIIIRQEKRSGQQGLGYMADR